MHSSYDFIIVGAGIMGLLTAYELAPTQARILIVDQQQAGQESSWAGGGILSPLYPWRAPDVIQPLFLQSLKHYPNLIEALQQQSGIDPQYWPCGLSILNPPDSDDAFHWAQEKKLPIHLIEKNLWLPFVAQVRNPRLLKALLNTLQKKSNIQLIEYQPILDFKKSNEKIISIHTPQQSFMAEHFIVCAGAWTNELLKPLNIHLPIEPVLGQMILLKPAEKILNHILLKDDCYLIPRQDGLILVGSTVEKTQFNKHITPSARNVLWQSALNICPSLSSAERVTQWAGLRPGTPEGIPYIGRVTPFENLWINAGHFRNGLTLAPASCQLLADLILKKSPALDPIPYQA